MRIRTTWSAALRGLAMLAAAGCAADGPSGPDMARGGSGVVVASATPSSVPQDTTLDILVEGSGFDQGSTVAFAIDEVIEPRLSVHSTQYVKSTALRVRVSIAADAPATAYDILVRTAGGKKGIGSEKLFVEGTIPEAPAGSESLGTLPGEEAGFVGDINDAGFIVGWARTCCGFPSKTWIWNPATRAMQEIGVGTVSAVNSGLTVQGAKFVLRHVGGIWERIEITMPPNADTITSLATSMNGSGMIAGFTTVGGVRRATVWPSPSDFFYISPMDPSWTLSWAQAINDDGWVAGFSNTVAGSKGRNATTQRNGFVWIPAAAGARTGCTVPLPAFNGSLTNTPIAMNNRGQVVGEAMDGNNPRIVLWEIIPGGSGDCPHTGLPPVDLGARYSIIGSPTDINDAGVVVGSYLGRQNSEPFIWDAIHGFRRLPADPQNRTIPRTIQHAPAGQPYVVAGERTVVLDPQTSFTHVIRWTVAP